MLSKKHYKAIAEIIAVSRINRESEPKYKEYESGINAGCQDVMHRLAEYFVQDNPQFDYQRFITACTQ